MAKLHPGRRTGEFYIVLMWLQLWECRGDKIICIKRGVLFEKLGEAVGSL
jgi:hypothetical protein